MQMLMAERFILEKMMIERLSDSAIKIEKSYWSLFQIRLQIQWAL